MPATSNELLDRLRDVLASRASDPSEVVRHERVLPAREAETAMLRPHLPSALGRAVRAQGVERLYAHQVEAIEHVRAGHHVVLTSPTASGKSLSFSVPTLERLMSRGRGSHALYLYPTKALIGDQLRALRSLVASLDVPNPPTVAAFTGDTPRDERQRMLADPPSILLANPDILHHSMLPGHRRWRRFLSGLDVVVLDELHAYRGVFGAHVSLVLRRLRRLAAVEGATPVFVAASATIGNPVELAEQVVGLPFVGITGDTAGSGARKFVFWRPPLRGDESMNEHGSVLEEAAAVFAEALRSGRRGILFGRARTSVERMLIEVRRLVGPDLADRVSAYKSGYTAPERAAIESGLRDGRLRGVVATNALELGIDVGALDIAVLAGYPGSAMSFWQQAGRVGRRSDGEVDAMVVLVGGDDALDQYYLDHPDGLFGAPMEQAVVDPGNPSILLGHLLCAARERPITEDELLELFPPNAPRLVERLVSEGFLRGGPPWRVEGDGYPHNDVGLRGASRESHTIQDARGRAVGTAEPPYLYRECHPGAVYLHNGQAYRVQALESAARVVRVEGEDPGIRTEPLVEVEVAPKGDPLGTRSVRFGNGEAPFTVSVGPLVVRETIAGYREYGRRGGTLTRALDEPLEAELETVGLWIDVPISLEPDLASLHALEHAIVNALPLAILCDRRNVGSTHEEGPEAAHPARIYIYDAVEGGIGLSEKAYHLLDSLAESAADLLGDCPCAEGCPNCVHLAGCGLANDALDKHGAVALLRGQSVGADRAVRRIAAGPTPPRAPRNGTQRRRSLRRIAEDDLRERFAGGQQIRVGELYEVDGEGLVVVRDVTETTVQVQPLLGGSRRWVSRHVLRSPQARG